MAFVSKGKLDYFKRLRNLSNKLISEKSGISISTIDKIFSGNNKNPNFDTITEIAKILDCSVDDLIDSDENVSLLYTEKDFINIAKKMTETEYLKLLFQKIIKLPDKDLELVNSIAERLSNC